MKKTWFIRIFLTVIIMAFSTFGLAGPKISNNPMTLPPSLAGLPTITAEPWLQIDPGPGVFLEGRDEGKFLRSTNVAFKPGTDEVYLTTSGDGGAWIYKFRGLAKGLKLFSHQ